MAAYLLDYDASLDLVLEEAVITLARLRAYPITATLAVDFEGFLRSWMGVNSEEIAIRIELLTAQAVAFVVDSELNDLSDATAKILDVVVKNERTDPEFQFYFGGQRPSDFKRPQLAEQLSAMASWPKQMHASPYPPLVEMGAEVGATVARAEKAVDAQIAAEQHNRLFRTTGSRRQLVDAFNALRKSTYGKLAEMPHSEPHLKLPRSFADRFFRPERAPTRPPSLEELQDKLAAAEQQVEDLKAQIDKLKKAKADDDTVKQKAQRVLDARELEKIKAEQAKLAAKEAELKARLGESTPDKPKD